MRAVVQIRRSAPKNLFRRGDGLRLTIATLGLIAMLVAVAFSASFALRSYAASTAAKAALLERAYNEAMAQAHRESQARRVGTIVLAADRGGCEELRFDNFTGAFIGIASVDCDTRLGASVSPEKARPEAGTGMRGMLKSFQK